MAYRVHLRYGNVRKEIGKTENLSKKHKMNEQESTHNTDCTSFGTCNMNLQFRDDQRALEGLGLRVHSKGHTNQAENWRRAGKCLGFWLYIYFIEGKSVSLYPSALVSYGILLQGDQGLNMSLLNWKQLNPKRFLSYRRSKALYYLIPQGDGTQPSILLYNSGISS